MTHTGMPKAVWAWASHPLHCKQLEEWTSYAGTARKLRSIRKRTKRLGNGQGPVQSISLQDEGSEGCETVLKTIHHRKARHNRQTEVAAVKSKWDLKSGGNENVCRTDGGTQHSGAMHSSPSAGVSRDQSEDLPTVRQPETDSLQDRRVRVRQMVSRTANNDAQVRKYQPSAQTHWESVITLQGIVGLGVEAEKGPSTNSLLRYHLSRACLFFRHFPYGHQKCRAIESAAFTSKGSIFAKQREYQANWFGISSASHFSCDWQLQIAPVNGYSCPIYPSTISWASCSYARIHVRGGKVNAQYTVQEEKPDIHELQRLEWSVKEDEGDDMDSPPLLSRQAQIVLNPSGSQLLTASQFNFRRSAPKLYRLAASRV